MHSIYSLLSKLSVPCSRLAASFRAKAMRAFSPQLSINVVQLWQISIQTCSHYAFPASPLVREPMWRLMKHKSHLSHHYLHPQIGITKTPSCRGRKERGQRGGRVSSDRTNKLLTEKAECEGGMQRRSTGRAGEGVDGRRWEDEWWREVEERSGLESGLMKKEYENGS